MRQFTLATLAVLVSAGSILTLSPSVKAETREAYCRHHQCSNYNGNNGNYNYNYNRGYNRGYNRNYNARNDHRQYGRSHDSRFHTGRYEHR